MELMAFTQMLGPGWEEGMQTEAPSLTFAKEGVLHLGNRAQEGDKFLFWKEMWIVIPHIQFMWIYVFVYILFTSILVSLGCSSNKIPQTRWLVNNINLFFTVLEPGSPRSRHQCVVFWWGLLLVHSLHVMEGTRELSGVSYMGTIPIHECSILMASTSPKGPISYHHLWGLAF